MEVNLNKMIAQHEERVGGGTVSTNGKANPAGMNLAANPPLDEPDDTGSNSSEPSKDLVYEIRNGHLYKVVGGRDTLVANFYLEIVAQHIRKDEGAVVGREFQINLHLNGDMIPMVIPSNEFCSNRFASQIIEHAGSKAIIYGNQNDLRIDTQERSTAQVKTITTSMGFNEEGTYLAPGMVISGRGIDPLPEVDVDLSEGNFSRHLGFAVPDPNHMNGLVKHLHTDFLQLKSHHVSYPLIGHIVLAAFASQLSMIGKQKPVMHLQGPSGGGKTFLGNLSASFYGTFGDRPLPWTSTANAIESEGFLFRDALFFIDDFKTSIVDQKKLIRIIQNSANSQGRARLTSGEGYRLTPMRGVRGLILSTGEDFISDVESVVGRTLLINVEPDQNQEAGFTCWRRRGEYRMLIPALLQWLLSQDGWTEQLEKTVAEGIETFRGHLSDLSNGMRVASNLALNAFGFDLFIRYSQHLGVIDEQGGNVLMNEYQAIVKDHIAAHAGRLRLQGPVEVFFQVISQKFAIGAVNATGLSTDNGGRLIGKVRGDNILCLFPDPTMEIIYGHFRSVGRRLPFTKEALRDALDRENLIIRSSPGRITHQVRMNGSRLQAWQFDIDQFKERCGMLES
ncbi:MAG: DUF927 domain-containing protein [Desulfobacteraceae bacterium]|nr:DUF927 domain-containing protein [Desulfobacteraceae bacterium]MBC2748957.1 DUF927 domain-containing protein [Desulfobacteraceae bacterium]